MANGIRASDYNTGGGLLGGLNQSMITVAQELQKYREKAEENQRESAFNEQVVRYARNRTDESGRPLMSNDDFLKYQAGSKNQKAGLVKGLVYTMADDMKREIAQSKMENAAQRTENSLLRTALQFGNRTGPPQTTIVDGVKYIHGAGGWQRIDKSKPEDVAKNFETRTKDWGLSPDAFSTDFSTVPEVPKVPPLKSGQKYDASKYLKKDTWYKNPDGSYFYYKGQNKQKQDDFVTMPPQVVNHFKEQYNAAYGGSLSQGLSNVPVKVATPIDAQKLPTGTRYQTPDGEIYTR